MKTNPTDPKTQHLMRKYISDCHALKWVVKHNSTDKGITIYRCLLVLQ